MTRARFVDVIPGHGEPFKGKERMASALHGQQVPAADAARRIDMTAHKTHFPTIAGPGVNVPAVSRLYDVIERRADQ